MDKHILIVEDEQSLVEIIRDRLEAEGYFSSSAVDGIIGEKEARSGKYELIVLDIMLPGRDGYQVCRNLRKDGVQTPILMLTARRTSDDTVLGLKFGADDYLAKPFDMQVLLARVEALLRRSRKNPAQAPRKQDKIHRFGGFTLDTGKQQLIRGRTVIGLNAQEYKLLKYFVENEGRTISRNELLDEAWGYDSVTTTRTVDVHVAWLRQKLEDKGIPRYIHTLRGLGYRFISDR